MKALSVMPFMNVSPQVNAIQQSAGDGLSSSVGAYCVFV